MFELVVVAGLFTAAPTAADVDPKMKSFLDFMSLNYACEGTTGPQYRSAKERALRRLKIYEPATTYTVKDITGLDRGLRSGKVQPPLVDRSDCENLILEAKDALPD